MRLDVCLAAGGDPRVEDDGAIVINLQSVDPQSVDGTRPPPRRERRDGVSSPSGVSNGMSSPHRGAPHRSAPSRSARSRSARSRSARSRSVRHCRHSVIRRTLAVQPIPPLKKKRKNTNQFLTHGGNGARHMGKRGGVAPARLWELELEAASAGRGGVG